MLKRVDCKFSRSTINTATGEFSGYGAVFENVDSHRDVIARGAFAETLREWKARGRMPRMLLMHGSSGNPFAYDDLPVGRWLEMREDAFGLFVRGQIIALDTDQGKRIRALMASGELDGLSIGYRVLRSSPGSGRVKRRIEAIHLAEVSIVDDPSNDLARVAAVSAPSIAAANADAAYGKLRSALGALGEGKVAKPVGDMAALADRIRGLARG